MSTPLHELAAEAPALSQIVQPDRVVFPFSNDDSIENFEIALGRTGTPEYRGAQNRVAVLIGESALTTNIHQIPEETIVLLDSSGPMVRHMTDYVHHQRTAPNATRWQWEMGIDNDGILNRKTQERYERMLSHQIEWWERQGVPHALRSPAVFGTSQELAREKAIIPWHGDITSRADMVRLGNALRKFDASVTLLNLSNVIPFSAGANGYPSFPTAAGWADVLAYLPTTPEMPILTASSFACDDKMMVEPTGPFFGLDHLREEGGDSEFGPVAIRPDMLPFDLLPRQQQRAAVEAIADLIEAILRDYRGDYRDWREF